MGDGGALWNDRLRSKTPRRDGGGRNRPQMYDRIDIVICDDNNEYVEEPMKARVIR
jgi:hypothetical protein